jgi:HEAT repeat protein
MKLALRMRIGLGLTLCMSAALAIAAPPSNPSTAPDSSEKLDAEAMANKERAGRVLSAAAWDTLSEEVRHRRSSHRSNAIAALATIGVRADTLPLLQGALTDKDASIRRDAAVALGDMEAKSAKPELRKLLDDDCPEVAFTAASVLSKMGDHSGREIFIATLQGDRKGDGFVKSSLKSNFAKYRDPKQLAMTGAEEAAGALFGPFSMGIVVARELMKDRTASARALSATLLAQDSSPDAVQQLTLSLQDKNWAVRAAAAQALAKSPGNVSPDVFKPLLLDGNDSVRTIAAAGIIRLSGRAKPKDLSWPLTSPPAQVTAEVGRR